MLIALALLANIIIVICELHTLKHIRGKWNILKYYTYLQNLLAMITSLVFSIYSLVRIVFGGEIPEFVKGLRYIATSGLVATMFIFIVFLGNGKRIAITENDFLDGFSPKTANITLHYICPILSLVSFVILEREICLYNGVWTGIAAIPSCIYWMIYIVLSATKMWEEPYNFSSEEKKNKLFDNLPFLLMPLSFIAISYVLWRVK